MFPYSMLTASPMNFAYSCVYKQDRSTVSINFWHIIHQNREIKWCYIFATNIVYVVSCFSEKQDFLKTGVNFVWEHWWSGVNFNKGYWWKMSKKLHHFKFIYTNFKNSPAFRYRHHKHHCCNLNLMHNWRLDPCWQKFRSSGVAGFRGEKLVAIRPLIRWGLLGRQSGWGFNWRWTLRNLELTQKNIAIKSGAHLLTCIKIVSTEQNLLSFEDKKQFSRGERFSFDFIHWLLKNAIPPVKPNHSFPILLVVGKVAALVLGDRELFDQSFWYPIDDHRSYSWKGFFSVPLIIYRSSCPFQGTLRHIVIKMIILAALLSSDAFFTKLTSAQTSA